MPSGFKLLFEGRGDSSSVGSEHESRPLGGGPRGLPLFRRSAPREATGQNNPNISAHSSSDNASDVAGNPALVDIQDTEFKSEQRQEDTATSSATQTMGRDNSLRPMDPASKSKVTQQPDAAPKVRESDQPQPFADTAVLLKSKDVSIPKSSETKLLSRKRDRCISTSQSRAHPVRLGKRLRANAGIQSIQPTDPTHTSMTPTEEGKPTTTRSFDEERKAPSIEDIYKAAESQMGRLSTLIYNFQAELKVKISQTAVKAEKLITSLVWKPFQDDLQGEIFLQFSQRLLC